ncbi:hypothetical protein FGIG_08525 [Fasciola gigantica]|uniref:Uncharacterized protein n=1 Tax=Fasciola gigantica TaxID=46835 RepID=A0A504Z7U1_FASGI|nr:hypothetical protein FGIG_08525 [Fasciola gigantica]
MELMRLNNRMHLPPASETEAVIHTAAAHPVPSATSITTASPSVRNVSAAGLVQTNNDLEPCSLNGLPFHAISTPMLDNSKVSIPFASPRLRSPIQQYRTCPCGNRQNCPLTPIKQRRFGNDPRVARGFTLLAAAFRGRLVRQLLATHKVCDLIRTVKDTAKLALSIHTERLSSFYQSTCNGSLLSNGHSAGQKLEGISSEELVLESRLMVQLRGALGQLHEVFFSWPLSNKLELLAISRSLTQRQKRLSNRFSNIREDSYSAEPMIDGWAPCEPMDASRRYQSGASHCSSRDIYDFPARRHMEKPGSYGNYSLTKSIDSVRQSWPQNPSLEKRKNASFPLSGLTALAYDNAEQQRIQPHESCEDLVSSVSNLPHAQMHMKNNTTAKSRTRIQSSLPTRRPRSSRNRTSNAQSSDRVSSPPDKLLSYTPVRLHTPPTPNTLESMTSIPAKLIDKSVPPSPTAMLRPPIGRASCFNLRQMCQNLRIERQRSSQTDLSISSSQHRSTQLHRRGALLVHRASSSTQLGSTVTLPDPVPIRTLKTEESKSSSLLRSRLIAKSQAHLARHHGGQKNKRCLSSLSLTDTQAYKTPWRIHRSTSALAEYPARVPYWKEVLWQWRHQRRDRAEIADELPMPINHNTTTRSDPTVQI